MGLINWLKDRRLSEMQFDIKRLHQEIELMQSAFESLKAQVSSIRTLVYRKKYADFNETEEKNDKPIDLQQLQRQLMGLGQE